MAAYADLSVYWENSDQSDGCPRWSQSLLGTCDRSDGCLRRSQSLLGTQWSEWWLPTLISVLTGHTVIGVMAANADLSFYRGHSNRSDGWERWPQSLLGTQWSEWWLPTLISVFTGHIVIGVMAAYADRSLYWAHSDRSDGCLRWSQSLLGTQWSEWWLRTLISVFTGNRVIGVMAAYADLCLNGHTVIEVMAAYADLSLYWAHSDHSRWLPTLISVFTGHTVIEVMAAYADLSLYWAHSDRSDGCLRWFQS